MIDLSDDDIRDSVRLMDTTLHLLQYRLSIAFAFGLLIVSSIVAGSAYVIISFLTDFSYLLLFLWLGISILAVLFFVSAFRNVLNQGLLRHESLYWIFAYGVIINIGYALSPLISPLIDYGYLWYILLGLGNLFIGFTVEKEYFAREKILLRPYLYSGAMLLLSSPVLVFIQYMDWYSAEKLAYVAIGLFLLLVGISSSVSIRQLHQGMARSEGLD